MYVPLTARLFCVLVGMGTMLQLIAMVTQGWYIDIERADGIWVSGKNPEMCADPTDCDLMTSSYSTKYHSSEINFREYSVYVVMQTFSVLSILLSVTACVLSFLFSNDSKKIQFIGPICILLFIAGIMKWAVISNFLAMSSLSPNKTSTPFSVALAASGSIITLIVVGIHSFYIFTFITSIPKVSSAGTLVCYEKHVNDENGKIKQQQQQENETASASCQVEEQKHHQYGSIISEHGDASLIHNHDDMEATMRESKLSYSVILS